MPSIWRMQWGHVPRDPLRAVPIVLGEWGGRLEGSDKIWQNKMAACVPACPPRPGRSRTHALQLYSDSPLCFLCF